MTERLTTLAAVKDWLNISTDTSDSQLTLVIDAVSQFVLNYLSLDSFRRTSYVQNFRGYGRPMTLLRNWPVLSVATVDTGGRSIAASTFNNYMPSSGWSLSDTRFGPQSIGLQGGVFPINTPCTIAYEAGFETTQTALIPTTPFQITPSNEGTWSDDLGVTINGVAAVVVLGVPTTGQYAVDSWGTYTFAAADTGDTAVISYSYTPAVISFAALELVGEWYKRKDRIGVLSKTLGGQETITFSQLDMNNSARKMLQPFINVVPA